MSQRNTAVPEQLRTLDDAQAMIEQGFCPIPPREILDKIAGKWAIQIVVVTARGPRRFTELEREIEGISRRMLTLTLRNLERDGLLERTVYPTVPPKVEYQATPMALELYEAMLTLTNWSRKHSTCVAASRERYDARQAAQETPGSVPAPGRVPATV
ncbi:winged helix-turn-helix transcriptional regulator [Nonomuraea angiospora]|uniref:DNA-binding HxlR family transcriptional regulator n=1 Tax=Nonomuraea angiospora TaxID=46172 RepID=A0ABR9MAW6_9ACTN|nr:helix-turn-helix domain-containing protein [Nonomuraea angiospora]MBE1590045.1 DNA-binding HxlR family transcriptional regulator [Nonomuraea angiospora]MDX3109602.1 helix-turn-helix domain-containing protein [Nonomuraea angiospora]